MKIYESGESLFCRISGRKVKCTTYVYVVDDVNIELKAALQQMLEYVNTIDNVIKVDADKLTITGTKGKYTLAHQRSIERGFILTTKPSNLLRHLFTRNFTAETLYYDDNKEIVDLTGKGVHDAENRTLNSIMAYGDLISADNSILTETLYLSMAHNCGFGNSILQVMKNIPITVLPIDPNDYYVHRIIEHYGYNSFRNYFESYNSLRNYFYNTCGFKFNLLIEPNKSMVEKITLARKDAKPTKPYRVPKEKPEQPKRRIAFTSGVDPVGFGMEIPTKPFPTESITLSSNTPQSGFGSSSANPEILPDSPENVPTPPPAMKSSEKMAYHDYLLNKMYREFYEANPEMQPASYVTITANSPE